jgi:hypothetical protein
MFNPASTKTQHKGQVSTPVSLPAPTGGWNARDSVSDMAPNDAVSLENFFPGTSDVFMRYGHTRFSTGFPAQVETIMIYNSGTTSKMFGISNGAIYDATAGGAIGAAAVSGLGNSRWEYINNTTAAGTYIQLVNGTDVMQVYTGSAWKKDGDGAPYDITGVVSSTLSNICNHKFRVWFVQKNTLKSWYLATGAIGGAATAFDLSAVAQEGGYLVAMFTWTIDAGFGVDDLLCFVTSQGEVIVYRGTDPSSATTWALVGIWRIGAPIGKRCGIKFAGDLLLITQDGVYPMSGALQSSRTNPRVALTDKIQFATSVAVSSYGSNFGWQLLAFPKENMLFLNVPIAEGSTQQQYVMNTITKAWCNFTGWAANCWELFNDSPYFGGSTFIGKAWNTIGDNGANISANGLQAFNYFGANGIQKRCTMIRPVLLTDGSPGASANVNFDFDKSDTTGTLSFTPTTYGTWDSAVWDVGIWGGGLNVSKLWQGAYGIGYAIAPRLKVASMGVNVHWVSTDLVVEKGGIL